MSAARDGSTTLSLAILAGGPAHRVRALLELMRPHVDELVLAVDRAHDPGTLEACADLADRRLTYEVSDSPARLIAWLLHHCSGEWILRLDDDEIPSAALLEALPQLCAERHPSAFLFRRAWLYPAADRYIVSSPWKDDFHRRLLRNLPGQWRFDGSIHSDQGEIQGELRILDLMLYHADALITPRPERERKRREYEAMRPGLVYNDASVNDLYVPEEFPTLETVAVPPEDGPLIDAVLDPEPSALPGVPADREGPPVIDATRADVDRFNESSRARSPASASLAFVRPTPSARAGGVRWHEIVVENTGDEPWRMHDEPPVRVAFRWRDQRTERVVLEGRADFTETVRPGRQSRMLMRAPTPLDPGEYQLEADVVHENVRWFGLDVRIPVVVTPDGPLAHRDNGSDLEDEEARLRRELADAHRRTREGEAAVASMEDFKHERPYRAVSVATRALDFARARLQRPARPD
jgi:hypothetical protein